MKPTVGRIVHYTSLGDRDGLHPPQVQAAIITKVAYKPGPGDGEAQRIRGDWTDELCYPVSLRIFSELGEHVRTDVEFTQAPAGSEEARGKWTWPERRG